MKSAVVVFPASNCDRDVAVALEQLTGVKPHMVWHGESQLPDVDLIVLPGGFSYGDYLRCGAMAAQSRIMRDVIAKAGKGVTVLGICNGFQILTESRLLPGALMRCQDSSAAASGAEGIESIFTRPYSRATRHFRSLMARAVFYDGDAGPSGRENASRSACQGESQRLGTHMPGPEREGT